jgi:hypothetical protein
MPAGSCCRRRRGVTPRYSFPAASGNGRRNSNFSVAPGQVIEVSNEWGFSCSTALPHTRFDTLLGHWDIPGRWPSWPWKSWDTHSPRARKVRAGGRSCSTWRKQVFGRRSQRIGHGGGDLFRIYRKESKDKLGETSSRIGYAYDPPRIGKNVLSRSPRRYAGTLAGVCAGDFDAMEKYKLGRIVVMFWDAGPGAGGIT